MNRDYKLIIFGVLLGALAGYIFGSSSTLNLCIKGGMKILDMTGYDVSQIRDGVIRFIQAHP